MPTRIISWQQQVLQADPGYYYDKLHPLQYEFGDGRLFYASGGDIYHPYLPVTDEYGSPLYTDSFNILETDHIPFSALTVYNTQVPGVHDAIKYLTDQYGNVITDDSGAPIVER